MSALTPFESMVAALRAHGFTDGDQQKDFSVVIPYVVYLRRVHDGKFQYLCLVTYEGAFCEAVFEAFLVARRNTKPKGANRKELERLGFVPETAMIYRPLSEILAAVGPPS